MRACVAAFHTGAGQSRPYDAIPLPARVKLIAAMPDRSVGTEAVIVQIESAVDKDLVVAGLLFPDGAFGIGLLADVEIIEFAE